MKGLGIAHGAATIVNAIATGKGAAFGLDLFIQSTVELTNEPRVHKGKIIGAPRESTILIELCAKKTLEHFKAEKDYGAAIKTQGNIPIARGLKSSSVAANATVLATAAALGEKLSHMEAINIGVDAAIGAGVTITGAFDDACASYFGGGVITDNNKRKILKRVKMDPTLSIKIYIPRKKVYTASVDVGKIRLVAPQVELAFKAALKGDIFNALTLNGLVYSAVFGYDPTITIEALDVGAEAAGISGTGPAHVAIFDPVLIGPSENCLIRRLWRERPGYTMWAGINNKIARGIRLEK